MNEYLQNILPAPFTILGKRLKPFSIGRAIFLHRFGCYPVTDFEKLITAAIVCSRPCSEVLDTLADPWLSWKLKLWRLRLGKFDPFAKIVSFNEYLNAYSNCPEIFFEGDGDAHLGAPFLQHLSVLLQSRVGWTMADVEEKPLSKAYWDYYTYWEIEDKVRVVDIGEDFARAMVEESEAKNEERLRMARESIKRN